MLQYDFYNFNENVYSTFSKEDVDKRVEKGYKIIDVKKVEIDRLENIIAKYLPKYTDIDFMSIDTEGLDLIVLQSNNWKKYRPSFICVEIMEFGSNMIKRNKEIDSFLCSVKYKEVFFNGLNSIYKDIIKS